MTARVSSPGHAAIDAGSDTLPIDAGWATEPSGHPGPAELLAAAFAACLVKNLERSGQLLDFRYESAQVVVTARRQEADKVAVAEPMGEGPIQAFLGRCARELGLWIIGGTIPLRLPNEPQRVAAASLVFDDRGRCVGRYDKIHLFDVDIPQRIDQRTERYRESSTVVPGNDPAVVPTPFGRIGMAVCYDVRFPELFRVLQEQGAEILSLPSAFTAPTGKAHWELLVRARAVENLCYVLAPAQSGIHANGRETWGDSLIVDPWGQVLSRVTHAGGRPLDTHPHQHPGAERALRRRGAWS